MGILNIENIVYGPVPSRRLGRSLGINNIPPKVCSYSCMYCQVGKTDKMSIRRKEFFNPKQIFDAVKLKVNQIRKKKEAIDYLAFVPDGEPTLDANLGTTIDLLKSFDIPIAIITNSSLIDRPDVQNDLFQSDWISFKVDSVYENTWHMIDRPHGKLKLKEILEGLLVFKKQFLGRLVTETMMVKDINDDVTENKRAARFLAQLQPDIAYISLPTRPPAESGVRPASAQSITNAFEIFKQKVKEVELLTGYEGNKFSSLGNTHDDILSITAVHPMRIDALQLFLRNAQSDWSIVDNMLQKGEIVQSNYDGHTYYLRAFR